jgi:hypothetical protein
MTMIHKYWIRFFLTYSDDRGDDRSAISVRVDARQPMGRRRARAGAVERSYGHDYLGMKHCPEQRIEAEDVP